MICSFFCCPGSVSGRCPTSCKNTVFVTCPQSDKNGVFCPQMTVMDYMGSRTQKRAENGRPGRWVVVVVDFPLLINSVFFYFFGGISNSALSC